MNSMVRTSRLIGLTLIVMLLITGCGKATGGGWMASARGSGKATFGFNGKCRDKQINGAPAAVVSGQLEYKDAAAGVKLHGVIGSTIEGSTCAELETDSEVAFSGSYRPQPKGAEGTFLLTVTDAGQPGRVGDTLLIQLIDGAFDGYQNEGPIGGGNIQIH